MPTFADSRLPKPHGWEEFEKIVCSVAKIRWNSPDFTRHGRQGQAQDGVDVYGQDKNGALIGLQCKNTIAGVSEATMRAEISKAEMFEPRLSKLYVATTADADAKMQGFIRALSAERRARGQFDVAILFWGDLWDELTRDESRLYQHYPQLRPPVGTTPKPSHDQELFKLFKSELAFDPSIRLLKDQDFGAPFQRAFIQPFFSFVESWDSPEREFIDPELQTAFKTFHEEARSLANCISLRVSPVRSADFLGVYSDSLRDAGARPEHVIREAREMNDAANRFVPMYEAFVRLARTKLAA